MLLVRGRGEASQEKLQEKEESRLCFQKDHADSSVGKGRRVRLGQLGGRGITEMENIRGISSHRCHGQALGMRPTGGGMKRSRSDSKDPGSFKGAERLFNNQFEKVKGKQEILEDRCFSIVLNY